MFQQPSQGGDKVPVAELTGNLVLILVREHRTGITTVHGEKDAVACDVHVLDGPQAGTVYDNALLFQGALIGALKPAVGGEPVLARIVQGTAKPGQNPPFILSPFTDQDVAIATPYWQQVQARQFQPPATQQAQQAGPANGAAPAAAATPSPAASSASANGAPAGLPNGMTPEAFAQLPPEVQELIRQSAAA